jgi:hypothetical protein
MSTQSSQFNAILTRLEVLDKTKLSPTQAAHLKRLSSDLAVVGQDAINADKQFADWQKASANLSALMGEYSAELKTLESAVAPVDNAA